MLWVDNEIGEFEINDLAEKMSESKMPLEKLERIFLHEVAPVCWGNVLSWSVWTAFDTEWLTDAILKNIEKQERNFLYRCWIRSPPAYLVMAKLIWEDWEKAKSIYLNELEKN